MKTGLILEGGAMRGMYTAGVLDIMMENGIEVDGAIGVSAGAVFGCNYKSKQIGRTIRYNVKYCRDPRYMGVGNLLKNGDLFGAEFCYETLPWKLDLFDQETYRSNPMAFYVACTDVHTGKTVYHLCEKGDEEDIQWMRASASMPVVSNVVSVGGYQLQDGAVSDSIPFAWFRSIGYEKNIVILTRQEGYRKKKSRGLAAMRLALRNYPALYAALAKRHEMYNAQLDELKRLEQQGEILVIRPTQPVQIQRIERNPEKLKALYYQGRRDGKEKLEEMRAFLGLPK